jgi:diaminobutyrate-2-oxoglutarate transaminase
VQEKGELIRKRYERLAETYPEATSGLRGRGMMQGIALTSGDLAAEICAAAFRHGLIIETSGPEDEVIKCLAPLTISDKVLEIGFDMLEAAFADVLGNAPSMAAE